MNTTYYVRANAYDYEKGYWEVERSFDRLGEARAFRDKVKAHIADCQAPCMGENVTEEQETAEARAKEVHRQEALDWFPSGAGYFTSQPVIVKRVWSEEVVT